MNSFSVCPSPPPSSTGPAPPIKLSNIFRALQRSRSLRSSRQKWFILANLLCCLVLVVEVRVNYFTSRIADYNFVHWTLYLLLIVFFTNFIFDLFNFVKPNFGYDEVVLTSGQMGLLDIHRDDSGFRMSPEKNLAGQHPNPFSPPKEGSFLLSESFAYMDASAAAQRNNTSPLPETPQKCGDNQNAIRRRASNRFNSSFGSIQDERQLKDYLNEYEEWDRQNTHNGSLVHDQSTSPHLQNSFGVSPNSTMQSFWKPISHQSPNKSSILDYSALLSKLRYQLSTPSPTSKSSVDSDSKSGDASKCGPKESICYRVGIDPLELVNWLENLRMWISQTILVRLVKEIEETNRQLTKLGISDALIGQAGLEKVKKCAHMPQVLQHIPSFHKLTPFLELSPHQDYLVNRIRELSTGGAMSSYKWNGGGTYNNADWTDKLPTDAELVMHCVSCYLDSRIPPVKGVVDGRVFSTLYYFRVPEKPRADFGIVDKDSNSLPFAVVQTGIKPPNYILQIGQDKLELSAGRNNLFHTLLLFLHHIKTKEHGMLGRINLGISGINVLWVID